MLFLCCRWGAICCECARLAIENSHLSPETKQERSSALRRALQVAPENFNSPNLTRGSSSWYWPTPQVANDAQTHSLLRIWCPICALSCGVSGSTLELAWMVGTKMCPALRINEQGLPSSSRTWLTMIFTRGYGRNKISFFVELHRLKFRHPLSLDSKFESKTKQ